jgi:hypothetical protein
VGQISWKGEDITKQSRGRKRRTIARYNKKV